MKVFLAWSGPTSHRIAKLLHGWLPDVIQSVEPFMSEEDIRTGTRWFNEIGNQLEHTHFGILCTTPVNLDSTWMHFEAGALSKNVPQARVCALLFELSPTDIALPLSQFQHAPVTEEGVLKLMLSMDDAGEKQLGRERIERAVKSNWGRLRTGFEEARQALAEEKKGHKVPRRSQDEILAGILDAQQGVLARLQGMELRLSLMSLSGLGPPQSAPLGISPVGKLLWSGLLDSPTSPETAEAVKSALSKHSKSLFDDLTEASQPPPKKSE